MKSLSIREMRASLGRLDELMERENELVVTRRGKAIARVTPFKPRQAMPSHASFREGLPEVTSSTELIREDRDGR